MHRPQRVRVAFPLLVRAKAARWPRRRRLLSRARKWAGRRGWFGALPPGVGCADVVRPSQAVVGHFYLALRTPPARPVLGVEHLAWRMSAPGKSERGVTRTRPRTSGEAPG